MSTDSSDTERGNDRKELDRVFDALASEDRRILLANVYGHDPVPYEYTGELEDGISLIHIHIPKLHKMGYVDWDRDAETLTTGPAFDEIRPFLAMMDRQTTRTPYDWPS